MWRPRPRASLGPRVVCTQSESIGRHVLIRQAKEVGTWPYDRFIPYPPSFTRDGNYSSKPDSATDASAVLLCLAPTGMGASKGRLPEAPDDAHRIYMLV